jgi:hypothetical protein
MSNRYGEDQDQGALADPRKAGAPRFKPSAGSNHLDIPLVDA